MANRKKPYMRFETKEDFDNHFDEVFNKGKTEGFKDGCIWVLSYVEELFKDMFKPAAFEAAYREIHDRKIEKWRKDEDLKSLKEELDLKNTMKNFMKELEENPDRVF